MGSDHSSELNSTKKLIEEESRDKQTNKNLVLGGGRKQRTERERAVFVPRALFHSGTPLVARSTAEAASQSPLLVRPVTLHHWGQRALRLPINEPASASVPLSTPQPPTIQRDTRRERREEGLVSAAPWLDAAPLGGGVAERRVAPSLLVLQLAAASRRG